MKAQIIDTQHSVLIENVQIDLYYNFINPSLSIFVDGIHFTTSHFKPGRIVLNYNNILELAVYYYQNHMKTLTQNEKIQQ